MVIHSNDQATLNDLLIGLTIVLPRFVMGTIIPEHRHGTNGMWSRSNYLWTDALRKNVSAHWHKALRLLRKGDETADLDGGKEGLRTAAGPSCRYGGPRSDISAYWLRPPREDPTLDPLAASAGLLNGHVQAGLARAANLPPELKLRYFLSLPHL